MTRDQYAKAFVEDAKARGKSKEETRAKFGEAMAQYDRQYPQGSGSDLSYGEKVQSLSPEQKTELGQTIAGRNALDRTRNVGKEKPWWKKAVEKTANVVGFGTQVGAELVGGAMGTSAALPAAVLSGPAAPAVLAQGYKKGSAAGAATMAGSQGLIRELYQDIGGTQEQSPAMAGAQPFIDAGTAAAIDYTFNVAFDDVIPALGETNIVKSLVGKSKKRIKALSGEVVSKAGKSAYEHYNSIFGKPEEGFIEAGMDKIKWWKKIPDKFGNQKNTLGEAVNWEVIKELSNKLKPVLKEASDRGERLTLDVAEKEIEPFRKNLIGNLSKMGFEGDTLKSAVKDGGDVLEDVLSKIKKGGLDLETAKKISTDLYDGTYTMTGRPKITPEPKAQQQVAHMITKWIKDVAPDAAPIMREQRKLILMNDMIRSMATNVQKEHGQNLAGNLSANNMKNIAQEIRPLLFSAGALAGGSYVGGPAGAVLGLLGAGSAALTVPSLRRNISGGSADALLKASSRNIQGGARRAVGEVTKAGTKAAGRFGVDSLLGGSK